MYACFPCLSRDIFSCSLILNLFLAHHHDLLGDDDIQTTSPPLQDQSAEIGNLKNQLQSTNRSLASAKEEREALEQTLANQASQLSTIQTQLSSAKAAYETETSLLTAFKERRATQINNIQKNREELIRAESDLSAVRVEKAEIEGALLRDKEEARELHRRMVEIGQQAEALKADAEKLKKEAKQQKGLLAIARKQLSTKENEKIKAEKEHEEAVAELMSVTAEKDAVEAEIANLEKVTQASSSPSNSLSFAAAQPLPVTPDLSVSPKSNNPFERLAMSSGNSTPRSQSPFMSLGNTIISSPPMVPNGSASPNVSILPDNAPNAKEITHNGPDTELSYLADEVVSPNGPEGVLSPETATGTDFFMTPPTSATNDAESLKERFPSLDDLTSPVPAVSKPASVVPPAADSVDGPHELDLGSQIKELEIEDSDSDSDSEDEHDAKINATSKSVPVPAARSSPPPEAVASHRAFDDVFGSDEPIESHQADSNLKPVESPDANFSGISNHIAHTDVEIHPAVAGVSEFDEALGKLPASTVPTPATFSFDTAFDDNFDFASASKLEEIPNVDKQKEVQTQPDWPDIFAAPSPIPPVAPEVVADKAPNGTFETSFDAAFFDANAAVQGTDKVPVSSPPVLQPPNVLPIPGSSPSTPIRTSSPEPISPKAIVSSPRTLETKPASPPTRSKSPPPRVLSPQPRVSSSSSKELKEVNEKHKEPTRSSKLSVSFFVLY